jgi:hypothetical protein
MNKFEAAVIRRFKTPQNFLRELGLPPRLAMDEAPGGGEEKSSAVQLIGNLISHLDPGELEEVSAYLRSLVGDARGISRAAKDALETSMREKTTPPDEVGDRRGRAARDRRMGRDEPPAFMGEPRTNEEGNDRRRMAGDAMAFDSMFPDAVRIG